MSNTELAVLGGAVPAHIKQGSNSALAKALAGNAQGKRLSIKGGVFRLIVGGKEIASIEDRKLPIVIANAMPHIGRTFYAGKYSEDQTVAPKCWSADGLKPDPDVTQPESNACASCPQNIKGSGDNDSRACRYSQRLAVVLANDIEGHVLQLQVPATSLFGKEEGGKHPLQSYARLLKSQGVDPDAVVTEMSFDTKAPVPKLFFKPVRYLTQEEYAAVQQQGQSEDAMQAITFTVAKQDGVAAEPAAKAAEEPEPKARAKKAEPPATTEGKPDVAALLKEWDDEA